MIHCFLWLAFWPSKTFKIWSLFLSSLSLLTIEPFVQLGTWTQNYNTCASLNKPNLSCLSAASSTRDSFPCVDCLVNYISIKIYLSISLWSLPCQSQHSIFLLSPPTALCRWLDNDWFRSYCLLTHQCPFVDSDFYLVLTQFPALGLAARRCLVSPCISFILYLILFQTKWPKVVLR